MYLHSQIQKFNVWQHKHIAHGVAHGCQARGVLYCCSRHGRGREDELHYPGTAYHHAELPAGSHRACVTRELIVTDPTYEQCSSSNILSQRNMIPPSKTATRSRSPWATNHASSRSERQAETLSIPICATLLSVMRTRQCSCTPSPLRHR